MTKSQPIRTLLFSTLYPSSARPGHGIFVETRLRELLKCGQIHTKVIAPVPWFFSSNPRFGEYARMAKTPKREEYHGIDVLHPRYFLPPRVGMNFSPLTIALAAKSAIQKLIDEGFDFDVIDAHYYYPDGVAAALLARHFKKPLVITARGTDLNLIPRYCLPRLMMQWAANRAEASIGVCAALIDVLRSWNVPTDRLHVMRNGVDLERFRPIPQNVARTDLHLEGAPLLISVGYLVERKGHHVSIGALPKILAKHPGARLLIVGEGPEKSELLKLSVRLGVESRVVFAGPIANADLFRWYSAADIMILASSREGWANVLLESMACGTPVVATRIWGTPEVVGHPVAGRLVDQRDEVEFANGVCELFSAHPDRIAVRDYAEQFSWESTSRAQHALFEDLSSRRKEVANA